MTKAREIAEQLTLELFTDGVGRPADRLVLMVDGPVPHGLGGWGRIPFAARIEAAIVEALKEAEREAETMCCQACGDVLIESPVLCEAGDCAYPDDGGDPHDEYTVARRIHALYEEQQ